MNRHSSRSLVVLIFLCFCYSAALPAPSSARKKHPVYEDSEGYALLSTALLRAIPNPQNSAIYIGTLTTAAEDSRAFALDKCVKVPPEFREAADDYLRKAKLSFVFHEKFALRTHYSLVPESGDLSRAGGKGKKKDIGIFDLSAVGFDQARTRAILRINNVCGSLCGGGDYYFFIKGENGWEEVKGIPKCTWVC